MQLMVVGFCRLWQQNAVTVSSLMGHFSVLHGLAMRKVSVCLSVRPSLHLSNACIVTKWKRDVSRFLYHTKDHLA